MAVALILNLLFPLRQSQQFIGWRELASFWLAATSRGVVTVPCNTPNKRPYITPPPRKVPLDASELVSQEPPNRHNVTSLAAENDWETDGMHSKMTSRLCLAASIDALLRCYGCRWGLGFSE